MILQNGVLTFLSILKDLSSFFLYFHIVFVFLNSNQSKSKEPEAV